MVRKSVENTRKTDTVAVIQNTRKIDIEARIIKCNYTDMKFSRFV